MSVAAEQVGRLSKAFENYYPTVIGEDNLDSMSEAFRKFWRDKILNGNANELRELDDMDPIIRIVDSAAKRRYDYTSSAQRDDLKQRLLKAGEQYGLSYTIEDDSAKNRLIVVRSFHVARCMLTQRDWYRIFRDLKANQKLALMLNGIFGEEDSEARERMIDDLRRVNVGAGNLLTSTQAVAINALLFCNDPSKYSSVVSLAHRKLIVGAFGLGQYSDAWSYGQQVVRSNELLISFNTKFGTGFAPRKLSSFFYWESVQPLWKPGRPISSSSSGSEPEEPPLELEGTMPSFHNLEEPQKKGIGQIVGMAQEGQLAIPLFQRDFVWNAKDIVDLFESILRGYFVGSVLLWTVNGETDLKIDPVYGTGITEEKLKPRYLILDGQQRISSIFYAARAPNQRLWNTTRPYVFFIDFRKLLTFSKLGESANLIVHLPRDTAERRGLMQRPGQFDRWYFPMFEFPNLYEWLDEFEEYQQTKLDNPPEKLREMKKRLREYLKQVWEEFEVPFIILPKDMNLVDVAKIFEKLNSTGVVLTVFDLLNARMVKHKIMLRQMWEGVRTSEDFPLLQKFSEGDERFPVYVLQTIALFRGKSTKREELLNLAPDDFREDWVRACNAIERALQRATNLRDGFGVISPKWLPYITMVPVLSLLLDKLETRVDKPQCITKINRWYWSAIATHAYSGSTDTQIAQDSREMLDWFEDDSKVPQTVRDAKDELKPASLMQMVKSSDAVYASIMCLVALKGGRDFLKVNMIEFNTLDDHHIFPRSRSDEFKAGDMINAIVNRTLIDRDTNEKYIRDSRPSEYLRRIMREQGITEDELRKRLDTHLIDSEAFNALLVDDYQTFISRRAGRIIDTFSKLV
jgi:hypothetical protein